MSRFLNDDDEIRLFVLSPFFAFKTEPLLRRRKRTSKKESRARGNQQTPSTTTLERICLRLKGTHKYYLELNPRDSMSISRRKGATGTPRCAFLAPFPSPKSSNSLENLAGKAPGNIHQKRARLSVCELNEASKLGNNQYTFTNTYRDPGRRGGPTTSSFQS